MEELQFLGFVGILVEACKLIASGRKLFSRIALFLILPLCLLTVATTQISVLLVAKISSSVLMLNIIPEGSAAQNDIISQIFSESAALLLFKTVSFVVVTVLSLFSNSAVVYTVVCIYTAQDASFRKVMKISLKVFKRVMVTFLCRFAIILVYSFTFIFPITMIIFLADDNPFSVLTTSILFSLFLIGLIYINIVWYLSYVVCILEDVYGFSSLRKSKNLIRGNKWTVLAVMLVTQNPFIVNAQVNMYMGQGTEVVFTVILIVIMTLTLLVTSVVQTVVYFVSKSYHHESIEKSTLSDRLDALSGEYLPLKQNDVLQLGQQQC